MVSLNLLTARRHRVDVNDISPMNPHGWDLDGPGIQCDTFQRKCKSTENDNKGRVPVQFISITSIWCSVFNLVGRL